MAGADKGLSLTVETSAKTRFNLEAAYYNVVRLIRSMSFITHNEWRQWADLASFFARSTRGDRDGQEAQQKEEVYYLVILLHSIPSFFAWLGWVPGVRS